MAVWRSGSDQRQPVSGGQSGVAVWSIREFENVLSEKL